MLEDTDAMCVRKSTVYADNLPWPTAVFCYGGGIFVAQHLIFFFERTQMRR